MRYFNLYSDIFITKGYNRILISDLNRNTSKLYPLELHDLLAEFKSMSIESVFEDYDPDSKLIVQEYLDYLLENEYGFITTGDWDKNFIPLDFTYHDPNTVSNLFLELEQLNIKESLVNSIANLNVKHLVIFCKSNVTQDELIHLDRCFENTTLEGIELFAAYSTELNLGFFQQIHQHTKRIYHLTFYGCLESLMEDKTGYRYAIDFTSDNLTLSSCGKISTDDFNSNMPKVLEALNHNSCLHKKLGIDSKGNIKNCPAMPHSYGNINEIALEEVLKDDQIMEYWHLTKEDILVCKDCEFRNVCTDCRAFTERTHQNDLGLDISKPLKCGYDPYSNEWTDWSLNPLKQIAMDYYGFQKSGCKD